MFLFLWCVLIMTSLTVDVWDGVGEVSRWKNIGLETVVYGPSLAKSVQID